MQLDAKKGASQSPLPQPERRGYSWKLQQSKPFQEQDKHGTGCKARERVCLPGWQPNSQMQNYLLFIRTNYFLIGKSYKFHPFSILLGIQKLPWQDGKKSFSLPRKQQMWAETIIAIMCQSQPWASHNCKSLVINSKHPHTPCALLCMAELSCPSHQDKTYFLTWLHIQCLVQ